MRCVSEQERAIWQFVNLSADPQARTKFMINNRTGAWKTDVNFLILANHGETANFSRKAVFFVTAKTIWTHLYIAWIPEVVSYSIFYNLLIREPFCWASICTLKSDTLAYQIKVNCYQQIILIHSVVKAHLASNRTEPPAHVSGNGQQM